MINIDVLLKSANEMEPLPTTAASLVGLTANDDWSWNQIVDIIKLDPIMATRVLRLANSAAYYTRSGPNVNIGTAAMRLGISNVLAIAIASGVNTLLKGDIPELGWGKNQLWRNAIAASLVPETVSVQLSIKVPGEASAAALLHNIGVLILRHYLKSDEVNQLKKIFSETGDIYAAENELFNMDHAEIGGMVLKRWNLPAPIVESVANHSKPNKSPKPCTDMVYLASKVAMDVVPPELDGRIPSFDSSVFERLNFNEERYNSLVAAVTEHLDEIISIYA